MSLRGSPPAGRGALWGGVERWFGLLGRPPRGGGGGGGGAVAILGGSSKVASPFRLATTGQRETRGVKIGIGLDGTLGLSYEDQARLSAEAARLGYTSVWTPEGAGEDSFLVCAVRWAATREVLPGGLTTGIGVSPVGVRTPLGFALSAGTMSKLTGR